MNTSKEEITAWLKQLQNSICDSLQNTDGKSEFTTDDWKRPEGGGGLSRVITNGNVIEKGGIMFSAVHGKMPDFLLKELNQSSVRPNNSDSIQQSEFYATGISIVLHPQNPMVPIIHMNIRYFEMNNGVKWLGGGIDLTPHYVNEDDAKFFHSELKKVCDKHHPTYYPEYKKWADDYFFIKHRNETRGIGGIFFDKLNSDLQMTFDENLSFWKNVGDSFVPIYTELINRNKNKSYTSQNKNWQLLRRGRYVEFNLIYDKGTRFGLESNGRIESILVSLPAQASWEYDFKPEQNSEEGKTLSYLKKGFNWV